MHLYIWEMSAFVPTPGEPAQLSMPASLARVTFREDFLAHGRAGEQEEVVEQSAQRTAGLSELQCSNLSISHAGHIDNSFQSDIIWPLYCGKLSQMFSDASKNSNSRSKNRCCM